MVSALIVLLIGLAVVIKLNKDQAVETTTGQEYFSRPVTATSIAATTLDAGVSAETPQFADDSAIPSSTLKEEKTTTATEPEPYESPVDFEGLTAVNEDVYAFLDIPGTDINYPVFQNPTDDTYYIRRDINGNHDDNGVLFTEATYTSKDFTDPVTIVYGHSMHSGKMFGQLEMLYSSKKSLEEHNEIVVYLPDCELHYKIFAAVPFDNRHILYNYDFTIDRTYRLFFQEILTIRDLQAVYSDDFVVNSDKKVLILSTCLLSDSNRRFLVCGTLEEVIPAHMSKEYGGQLYD